MPLVVLVAVLTLTSACASSTLHSTGAARGTSTPSPTAKATAALAASSQVSAYVGAGDHVYALDSHTGAVRWTYVTGHGTALGGIDTVSVMNGTVFAHGTGATPDGHPTRVLYALDATTGSLRWMFVPPVATGGNYAFGNAAPTTVIDGVVYLFAPGQQEPSGTYAVDLLTGKVLWDATTTGG